MQSRSFSSARIRLFLCAVALLYASGSPLSAQVPPPPVIPSPGGAPQNQPAAPGPEAPPAPSAARPPSLATQGETVTLQYPNSPVTDIVDFYERLTGRRIIRDSNLAGANLSIEVTEPVTKQEAVQLIEAVLLLNGYVFIDAGNNMLKIVNSAAKNPRSEGITLYSNAGELPEGEVVAAYFMPLTYITPEEALPIFQGHVQLHPYGSIVAAPNARALVITENASVIRQLIVLREMIDVPPAEIAREFVQLERADAEKVAELVNKLLESRRQQNMTGSAAAAAPANQPVQAVAQIPGVPQAEAGGQNGGAGQAASQSALTATDAQVMADPRTNRVIIVSRPLNMPDLVKLVKQFDEAVELMAPYEVQLSYISASETLPILVNLLAESDEDRSASITENTNTQQTTRNQSGRSTTFGGIGSSTSTASSISVPDVLGESNRQTAPQSVTVGSTTLIADNRANSILVIGPPESRAKAAEILSRLDRRPMQVYLSAVIGQITLREGQQTGIDVIQKFVNDGTHGVASSLITRTGDNQRIINPAELVTAEDFPLTAGLTGYVVVDDILDIYVNLLASSNDFKVIGRPTVFTQNNEKATILSGSRVAVPTQTLTDISNSTNTAVTSNINYEDVVLKLEVIPLINSNREITLQIAQKNDSIVGEQTISGNQVPTIGTQELTTTVTMPNKSTIVLGGLISTSNKKSTAGIPYLKDIPLLGYLFRKTDEQVERQELIVMIQPSVVETPMEILDQSLNEARRTNFESTPGGDELLLPTRRAIPVNSQSVP